MRMASRVTRYGRESRSLQEEHQQARAKWSNDLTKILADLMVEQLHKQKGYNKTKKSFTRQAWESITHDFCLNTGLKWDEQQLKSRYIALKKQYTLINSLLHRTHFHLDHSTGTVVATDQAWTHYIKEHPDAEQIRNHGCPFYNQLSLIFSSPARSNNMHESLDNVRQVVELSSESEAMDEIVGDDQPSTGHHRQPPPPPPPPAAAAAAAHGTNRKRGRKGMDDAIAAAIKHMAAASRLYTTVAADVDAKYTIADCIKALDEMQGVDQQAYFAALDLFNCRSKREIFMSLTNERRLTWLQGKL